MRFWSLVFPQAGIRKCSADDAGSRAGMTGFRLFQVIACIPRKRTPHSAGRAWHLRAVLIHLFRAIVRAVCQADWTDQDWEFDELGRF